MSIALRKQSAAVLYLVILSLLVSPSAFPQGREFERSRVMSYSATVKPIAGALLSSDYQISPGDVLQIELWREPELTREVRVRPDGKFSYPLIGKVDAAGLTIDQLQEHIRSEFLKYVRYPEVTVVVRETAGNMVIVLGEVIYPGLYTYKGQGDVLQAIGLAGDFKETAKRESVLVISGNFTEHPKVRRVNVFKSYYHGAGMNFLLNNGDVVYVPKTWIADWNKTINDLQPTLNTLLGTDMTNIDQDRTYIRKWYLNRDVPMKVTR